MRKIIELLIIFSILIEASNYSYIVSSPLFGELGKINIISSFMSYRYIVKGEAKTEKMASFLTKHRVERYFSKGRYTSNRWITDRFKIVRKMRGKRELDEYHFDYKSLVVTKKRLRWKHGVLKKEEIKSLKYFSSEDLIALYMNIIPKIIKRSNYKKSFFVVGAEKIGGKIIIYIPNKKRIEKELKIFGSKDLHIIVVTTNGKIFGKRNRELVMAIDNRGVLEYARLQALPVIGNIYIKRIR